MMPGSSATPRACRFSRRWRRSRAWPASSAAAQDTTRGVRIGLVYTPGTKPGFSCSLRRERRGDSVRAIRAARLRFRRPDQCHRTGSDGHRPAIRRRAERSNYPLYARLGALAVVQPTMTRISACMSRCTTWPSRRWSGSRISARAGARSRQEWRLSLHAVSDELEQWITGVAGVAATRIAVCGTLTRAISGRWTATGPNREE